MRLVLIIQLFYSSFCFANFLAPEMDEYLDLQEYRERNIELRRIQNLLDELEKNPCIVKNDHYNECSKPFSLMEDLLDQYQEQLENIFTLKLNIYEYLDHDGNILKSIEDQLEEQFPTSTLCSEKPLEDLIEQADSMLIFIQRLKQNEKYDRFLSIENAKKRDCDEEIKNDCWKIDEFGNVFYVSKKGLMVDTECLLSAEEGERTPDQYAPEEVIKAANLAVSKLESCFSELNPREAASILSKIQDQEYTMFCQRKKMGDKSHRCGYTHKGNDVFYLIFNEQGCDGYEETIFHEILHMNSYVDNLHTNNHNNGECAKHDAVYFCSRSCFPKSQRPRINFSYKACLACVKNKDEQHRCSNDALGTPTLDQSFETCR